jgi:hypothetical protein
LLLQTNANNIVEELSKVIAKVNLETLSFQCGRDFEPLSSSLDTMLAILNALDKAAEDGLQLLSCERIIPIYVQAVYTGTCNQSVTGLTWMFSSLLVISTFGMIMIMLRASFHNDVILADVDCTDEDSEERDMNRLARHGNDPAVDRGGGVHDAQQREYIKHWRDSTSDSGSVYTDGNGDLNVIEVDTSELYRQNPRKLYDFDEASYNNNHRSNLRPSAPYEGKY